jgi:hypothetical protein
VRLIAHGAPLEPRTFYHDDKRWRIFPARRNSCLSVSVE